jgi:hypothetical protein
MKPSRRIYWLVDHVDSAHREKALTLTQRGFEVMFFATVEHFITEFQARRASIVLVSDAGPENIVRQRVSTLVQLPEIQGTKTILVLTNQRPEILQMAAAGMFRDLVPLDLDANQWIQRIVFATANKSVPFRFAPGGISVDQIAALELPARIIWVHDQKIRIECRLSAAIGSQLNLGGALARALDQEHVSINVEAIERSHLTYRFSDAIIGSWRSAQTQKAAALMKQLRDSQPAQKCRVFLAARSSELRAALMTQFDHPHFDLATAIQKNSIVNEPRFFTPHVVVIEDELCVGEEEERFKQMLTALSPDAMVIIIGPGAVGKHQPGAKVRAFKTVPPGLGRQILHRYRNAATKPERAAFVNSDSDYSFASVTVPARILRIHPQHVQVATSLAVGSFALANLDAPTIRRQVGKSPYIKVVKCYRQLAVEQTPFQYVNDCYIANFGATEQAQVATYLYNQVGELLGVSRQTKAAEIVAQVKSVAAADSAVLPIAVGESTARSTKALIQSVRPEPKEIVARPSKVQPKNLVTIPIQEDRETTYQPYRFGEEAKRKKQVAAIWQAAVFTIILGIAIGLFWSLASHFNSNELADKYSEQFQKFGK